MQTLNILTNSISVFKILAVNKAYAKLSLKVELLNYFSITKILGTRKNTLNLEIKNFYRCQSSKTHTETHIHSPQLLLRTLVVWMEEITHAFWAGVRSVFSAVFQRQQIVGIFGAQVL